MANDLTVKEGRLYGAWRQPINIWSNLPGSIHNDEVAASIGMRGGTIPGTVHLNLFGPLLMNLRGKKWWENGSISMYYTYATKHKEDVRAVIMLPAENKGNVKMDAWVETPNAQVVCKGTVSVGQPGEGYVRKLELKNSTPGEARILADLTPGTRMPDRDMIVRVQDLDKSLETNTDPLDAYRENSPWGLRVIPPTMLYQPLNVGFPRDCIKQPSVGFFGATEIRVFSGPIKVGVTYTTRGKVVAVGVTDKTEYAWVDSEMFDKGSTKLIADMRHMTRWMKASSPLWSM